MQYHLLVMVLAGTLMLFQSAESTAVEPRSHFIKLLLFPIFVILFTLVIFMKVDNISSHC